MFVYFVGKTLYNSGARTAVNNIEVENQLLWEYYHATEDLLDSLEMEYNWVDAIEHYPYYESVENLYNIKK